MSGRAAGRDVDRDAVAIVVGMAVLVTGMVIVRDGTVPGWERRAFRWINDLPGFLYPILWPVQQLGVLAMVPVLALVLLVRGRRWLALEVLVVGVVKLVLERVVKVIATRERPGTSVGDIHARGTVSLSGESFVSGHALLITALAAVVSPYLGRPWQVCVWTLVVGLYVTRVYVGAHNPLDVVCGGALGLAAAGAIRLGFRRVTETP